MRSLQDLHARVLTADGKDRIGDVAVPVGIGEAQFFAGPDGVAASSIRGCSLSFAQVGKLEQFLIIVGKVTEVSMDLLINSMRWRGRAAG